MKTKKITIGIEVKYSVQLEVEVSENIANQLDNLIGRRIDPTSALIDDDLEEGVNWIQENIKERDAFDWDCEIDYLDIEE